MTTPVPVKEAIVTLMQLTLDTGSNVGLMTPPPEATMMPSGSFVLVGIDAPEMLEKVRGLLKDVEVISLKEIR